MFIYQYLFNLAIQGLVNNTKYGPALLEGILVEMSFLMDHISRLLAIMFSVFISQSALWKNYSTSLCEFQEPLKFFVISQKVCFIRQFCIVSDPVSQVGLLVTILEEDNRYLPKRIHLKLSNTKGFRPRQIKRFRFSRFYQLNFTCHVSWFYKTRGWRW